MDGLLRSTPFEWRWRDVFVFFVDLYLHQPVKSKKKKTGKVDGWLFISCRSESWCWKLWNGVGIDWWNKCGGLFQGEFTPRRWMTGRPLNVNPDGCPPKKSVGGGHWRAIELLVFYWINSAHPHTHTQMVSGGVENPLTTREALLSKAIGKLFSSFRLSLSKTFISSTTRMCVCVVNGSSLARKFTFRRLLVLYFQNKNYY